MQATGYKRWSGKGKQRHGSSDDRQIDDITEMCADEGWALANWVTDDGVSGQHGKNTKVGKLSDFIDDVKLNGGAGRALVVECQDRLSRFHEVDFFEWFLPILRTGLTIGFADNRMIVDLHNFRTQKSMMRRIMDNQEEASRYVDRLGRRVRRAYQQMREDGTKKVHNRATTPAWLELIDLARSGFTVRPTEAAIVRRIFEDAASGMGLRAIAKALNEEGVSTFRGGNGWSASSVRAILFSRAVIGEYQHKSRAIGEVIGDPIPDYFPAIIPNGLWQKVHDPRFRRIVSKPTQGDKFRNLFSDVARCHHCDSKLILIEKSPRSGAGYVSYLQCDSYARRRGCDQSRFIRYQPIEKIVVETLLTVALDDVHFQSAADVAELAMRLANEKRALADVGVKLDNIASAFALSGVDDRLVARYSALKEEETTAKATVKATEAALKKARGSCSPAAHIKRVSEIAADLNSNDPSTRLHARRVTKLALNDLIDRFEMVPGSSKENWRTRTEAQTGVAVLRGAMRYIHFDLAGEVIADISNGHGSASNDPIYVDYYRRRRAQ